MARNVFGLVHQFFSSTPPSHDPEEAAMFQDINSIPSVSPAELGSHAKPCNSFHPYPNQTSFDLGHWYWNGSVQKSQESFKELLNIVGCPDFDPENVRLTHWDKINSQLGVTIDDEDGYEWQDDDADATQLTTFSNVKLSLVYMYFGNESKYHHCKPSCHLANHVAYFQKLPDSFKDFMGTYTKGKGVGRECTTHCHRDLFQAQWRVLLDDEFLEAYEHGIVILCCNGIKCRFYPWVFTYSADYPEKQQRKTLACADTSRSQLVATAWNLIYEKNFGVDSTAVESILKPESWVPTSNTFSDSLGLFGFNIFIVLVVDLLHEVELGDLIHELDRRYRQVPPFGPATIRRFCSNVSEMSNMAVWNFEDLLQSSMAFSPEVHNNTIIDLLFTMSHWHGLAKLCIHSDLTLDIFEQQTTDLGKRFRHFKEKVCPSYQTQELDHEVGARSRRQAKGAAKRAGTINGRGSERAFQGSNAKGKEKAKLEQNVPGAKQPRRKKSFNIQTYKFHVLGDYVACIHHFGTTDSYSTEPGELEHHMPKGRYHCTDQNTFIRQLTRIECCEARLRRIEQWQQQGVSHTDVHEIASDPRLHHYIGQSERIYDEFGQYLRNHAGDPAMKDFLPRLKEHIFNRLEPNTAKSPGERSDLSFVNRDTIMRYHYGLGVGHIYSHEANILEDPCLAQVTPCPDTQTTVQMENEALESEGSLGKSTPQQSPGDDNDDDNDDEQEEDDDHISIEDLDFFD
ncbi:uncharacterized protein F5147DRAFT_775151 [Suillus discolor]|uniref:Uncharacterized protein n=1 Tax=Suillus discolor TaxID=1912936 RepID=A0A9P7F5F5_9AGAM|nr:uncharacterized protein F5147DRAFT_775151 [Suillus discolor]KAG2105838.1 hypothetical protein F5147DRAFT_775151 [Suillus discolor]